MVHHEVDHDIIRASKTADIVPIPETRIDLLVGRRGETSIRGGRVRREDMDAAGSGLGEELVHGQFQAAEIAAEGIGIRDELHFVL
jgi:hypothetical protein